MASGVTWITKGGVHIPITESGGGSNSGDKKNTNDYMNKKIRNGAGVGGNVNDETEIKKKQLEIIQKENPMRDDYHTGIRDINDIKTPTEAFKTKVDIDEDFAYPDFTKLDGEKALKSGVITIYSSKEIKNGSFVSPSKMMAEDYAGGGKIYSKTIKINDVAWINSDEGQFVKLK